MLKKCHENDNNVVKSVAFICKSNSISCAGNNYRMLLNAKNELTIDGLSVWNEICCKFNDSINVIKEMGVQGSMLPSRSLAGCITSLYAGGSTYTVMTNTK